nr:MAG TPA: hypothetical protein [Caudoviricetes sp.]
MPPVSFLFNYMYYFLYFSIFSIPKSRIKTYS